MTTHTSDQRPDMPVVVNHGGELHLIRRNPMRDCLDRDAIGTRYIGVIDQADRDKAMAWIRGALADAYHAGVIDGRTAATPDEGGS